MIEGYTQVAANARIKPYMGQWLKVKGTVTEVDDGGANVCVSVDTGEGVWVSIELDSSDREDYFAALQNGDQFAANGRIDGVSSSDMVFLVEGELSV